MTWPARYGGLERSQLERYVVIEELLAAGAPVAAHWTADRQSGPLLIRFAPETLAPKIVPGIVRGETWFCIGLSESDTGSDLASVRTRATSRTSTEMRISEVVMMSMLTPASASASQKVAVTPGCDRIPAPISESLPT